MCTINNYMNTFCRYHVVWDVAKIWEMLLLSPAQLCCIQLGCVELVWYVLFGTTSRGYLSSRSQYHCARANN